MLSINTNHLCNSSFLLLSIVLLLLLSLSLFALVSYCIFTSYSAIWLLSRKCGIKLSVSVGQIYRQIFHKIDSQVSTVGIQWCLVVVTLTA